MRLQRGNCSKKKKPFSLKLLSSKVRSVINLPRLRKVSHFLHVQCPALDEERVNLYSEAPPTVRSQIPDLRVHPQDFLEVVTGTCWVDDIDIQKFCIDFLAARTALLFPA